MGPAIQKRQALVWFMGMGLWTAFGGGCVADTIPFDREPIEAPVILDSPTSQLQIGDTFWVDREETRMWEMKVVVREQDPTRTLWARHRFYKPMGADLEMFPPAFEEVVVPAEGADPELRELTFIVRSDLLSNDSCHRLELVVSGSFDRKPTSQANGFFSYIPEDENQHDIAWALWWIWEGNPDLHDADMLVETCDSATDVLPPMMPVMNGVSP